MEVNDIEEIYRSIPNVLSDFCEPIPVHRQLAGNSRWVKVMNTISLAREIVRTNNPESERYIWAREILDRLNV
tara:strand:+ start:49 stop:267 length:219 start_codon:yes stop_codon:yes gene_type:complete